MASDLIKTQLKDDLLSQSELITEAVPFFTTPEAMDTRDGFVDHLVNIYEGSRRPNINVESTVPFEVVQEYVIQVYGRTKRMKGSEEAFEQFFDQLTDEVFDWIVSLADGNRIWDVTDGKLRVPNRADRISDFFLNKEEEISVGQHTYVRIRIQSIRKI